MTWQAIWWVAAIALVIAELFSGSLYLLAIALGALGAGISAWAGAALWVQALVCSAVSLVGIVVLRNRRASAPKAPLARENPDLIIDIGNTVFVDQWRNGVARVSYRGTDWDAKFEAQSAQIPQSGLHVIKAIDNNTLILTKGE